MGAVISGGMMGAIRAWPLDGGEPVLLANVGGKMVTKLVMSADGKYVRVDAESGMSTIVPLDGKTPTTPCGPKLPQWTAVADEDWTKQVVTTAWNEIAAMDGDQQRVLGRIDKVIVKVAISPRGDTVVISDGSTLYTVPFAGGELVPFAKYEGRIVAIEYSPDQQQLAVIGARHDILLVDARTGKTRELRGHTDALYKCRGRATARRSCRAATTARRGCGTSRTARRRCCAATPTTCATRASRSTRRRS